jgi:hypothetical protein
MVAFCSQLENKKERIFQEILVVFEVTGSCMMRVFTESIKSCFEAIFKGLMKLKAPAGPHFCRGIASEPRRDFKQPQRIS